MLPISVVVLSHNRIDELEKNIHGLIANSDIEIILVDNASNDGSREFLEELSKKNKAIKLIINDKNEGVAQGRNTGFKLISREFVLCLDDDSFISSSDLRNIPEVFRQNKTAGILALKVCHALTGEVQNQHGDHPVAVANFHGAGHAIRKELFEQIGYLDEQCTFGGEELDFSVRAHAAGYETIYVPSIVVHHNSFHRPGKKGAHRVFQWTYNYCRVLFKHFPVSMAFLFSTRYTYNLWKHVFSKFGFLYSIKLIIFSINGIINGLKNQSKVPEKTISFYNNSHLRPQYGNIPLEPWRKILKKLKKILFAEIKMAD